MSKQALNKDLFREIKKTRSRFFSVMMLVVIAVCFLFGLRMAAPDMKASMDSYLDEQQLMDVHIMSTLGLTQADVDVLAQTEGTEAVEGFYTVDALASGVENQDTLVVKAISLGESGINSPTVTEGRLPEAADECLVEDNFLATLGLELGDQITLDTGTGSYEDTLVGTTFTIVGVGKSPLYVSLTRGTSTLGNGSVSAIIVLPSSAYKMDYFTDLYVRVEGAEALNAYEDAYEDLIASYTDQLEEIRLQQEQARTEEVKADAQAEVDDAWTEYYDAEAEANQELADGWQELVDAREELDDGWADYEQGQIDLEEAWQQIADGWKEMADALETLQQAEQDYADGEAEYNSGKAAYDDGLAQYESGYEQYQAALAEYESGYAEYQAALQEYQSGEAAYADGLAQYEAAEATYQAGYEQYEAGEADYADGLAQYEAAEAEYTAGLEQYEAGEAAYADSLAQYEAGEAAYAEDLAEYEAGEEAYPALEAQYESDKADYQSALSQYQSDLEQWQQDADALEQKRQELLDQGMDEEEVNSMLAEDQRELDARKEDLDDTNATLESQRKQLEADQATLEATRSQLDESKATLEATRAELDETKLTLEATRTALDETKLTLEAGKTELDANKETLDAARAELDATKAVMEAGRAELDESKATLEATRDQLDAGKALLDSTAAQLAEGKAILDATKTQLSDSKATLDSSSTQLAQALAELKSARKELDDGWADYQSGMAELADAEQEAQDGEQELADAYVELTDGEADYADGLQEYEDSKADAEQELADARQEIEDAQKEVDDIDAAEWYILDRTSNVGFASYQQDSQRMTKLATLFPTVFFLVAALVCLTGMTRMVEEQRVEIGGLKALGYSKLDIARKYVGYGLFASLIGGVIGLVLGSIGIPWVIVSCWKVMYDFPGVTLTFSWPTALACLIAAVACCTVAVLVATLNALRATPASLMRPRAPQPGKRVWLEHIPFLWNHMSFSKKVTARNLFRYKKRFWMTVIGIAGCTGLMVTGFGLRDSITDVVDLQFGDISTYSAVLYTDDNLSQEQTDELTALLDSQEELTGYTFCYLTTVTLESDTYSLDGNLLAVDDPSDLDGFWNFRDRETQEPVSMQQEGALLSEKTAELLGLSVGDYITVVNDQQRAQVLITGIVENYIQHYVYLTTDAYEQAFGQRPQQSQVLLSYPESADWETMGSELLDQDGVSGIYYLKESQEMIKSQLEGVYPAVVIIISAAAALAFVVLYNLSSINITERLRELATLKVLGFRDREMREYVFRENLVLTLIGMVLGVIMGKWFHSYLITTVEVELVMFGRSAHLLSYVMALVLTLCFALLVNLAAGKKLRNIDMVESLKTVE